MVLMGRFLSSVLCCLGNGISSGYPASRSDDAAADGVIQQQLVSQVNALQAQVSSLQTKISQLTTPFAFTGEGGMDHQYNTGDTILFNRVLTNVGGMYDSLTGVVNIPQDGIYIIYLRSDPPEKITDILSLDLKVNGVHQIHAYGEHGPLGGALVALSLKAGDRVYVTHRSGGNTLESGAIFSVVRVSL